MNEKVENLILEHLRVMRSDIASLKEEMSGMRAEMRVHEAAHGCLHVA